MKGGFKKRMNKFLVFAILGLMLAGVVGVLADDSEVQTIDWETVDLLIVPTELNFEVFLGNSNPKLTTINTTATEIFSFQISNIQLTTMGNLGEANFRFGLTEGDMTGTMADFRPTSNDGEIPFFAKLIDVSGTPTTTSTVTYTVTEA